MAFDATVLCGALLKPNGLEFELLLRAAEACPSTAIRVIDQRTGEQVYP